MLNELDTAIFTSMQGHPSSHFVFLAFVVAKWVLYLVPLHLAFSYYKATPDKQKVVSTAILAIVIGLAASYLIGHFSYRPRPFLTEMGASLMSHRDSPSFPSNHATIMAAYTMSLVLAKWWRFALIGAVATLAVGWARVFMGVHYPFDILGGIVLGSVSAVVAWTIMRFRK